MATPQGESLVCAQCGPVVDLFTHRCFYPRRSSHLNAPRLAISTPYVPPSPQVTSDVVPEERRVRPPPTNLPRFRLCRFRPPSTCWNGDLCTYAHSEEELKAWNHHAVDGQTRSVLPRREANMQPSAVVGQDPRTEVPAYHHTKNATFAERVKDELKLEDIQAELTIENYKDKFHKLLCWEEMEHISLLHERCDDFYSLQMFVDRIPSEISKRSIGPHKKYGCLNVGDGDIIAYATQASESVHLIIGQNNKTNDFEAEILKDNFQNTGNKLYISVDESCALPNFCEKIKCQFEVKHSFFDTLHKVLDNLPAPILRRILPLSEDFNGVVRTDVRTILKNIPKEYKDILHLSDMNDDELVPYEVALSCQSGAPPVLISGAFGTGKTCFLSAIAYCFISEAERNKRPARVLICAHHQATADTILQTYFGPMLRHHSPHVRVKVVRITSNSHRNISKSEYEDLYETIRDFNFHFQEYSFVERLVVITTFLTSVHLKLYPFTHILIDEGAQAREPEAVAPLCLANMKTKIIIAGDPRQVGPALLVLGEKARKHGLKTSLLERLKAHYKSIGKPNMLQANLMKNFRCHQQILKFASEMFYKSLVTPSHVTLSCQSHPGFRFPLVFVCTSKEIVDHYDKAVNREEASILMAELGKNLKIEQKMRRNVCVMSSSRGQVTELRNRKFQWNMPDSVYFLTTYQIQGQEYDSLYISTCEPTYSNGETRNPTKSICDPLVFNTAITRARSLIVSFGNPYLLLSIEEHMNRTYKGGGCCWSQYLLTCMQRGTLIIPDSIIRSPNEKKLYKDNLTDILKSRVAKAPVCAAKPRHLPPQGHLDVSRSPPAKHPSSSERLIFSGQSKYNPSHVHFKPMVSVTSNCSTLPNKGPSSASPFTSSKQLPSMKNETKSPLTLPKKRMDNAHIPSNITQPALESREQISPAFKPRESFDKGLSSRLPTRQYDSRGMCSSSFLDKEFPTLQDAMKQKMSKRAKNSISSSHHDVVRELPKHTTYFQKYKEKLNTQMFETPYTLTVDNYQESFHHLLCWEEKEHMSILANRCNGRYRVKIFEKQPICTWREQPPWLNTHDIRYNCYGTISNANDDDDDDVISYAKQAAEAAYLVLDGKRVHVNFIGFGVHAEETITIGIAEKLSSFKKGKRLGSTDISFDCYVMFELKHSYFHRQHEALDALAPHVLERLLPKEGVKSNPQQLKARIARSESLYLDSSGQMQALTAILNQRANPVIIAGPFGTGKTRVLARATYELLRHDRNSRILICTHHQVSADTFIQYFGSLQEEEEETFFKWVKVVRVATAIYRSKIKEKYPGYYVSPKRAVSLNFQVIVCTLGLSHHLKGLKGLTHIFIDEAAQTRETEAIIPLQLAEIQTRIVLAGDHCQVDPDLLVLGDEARRYGLSTSLLQRLHQKYNEIGETTCSFSLLCNYRSHSGLLMLPSSLFYCSTLQCKVSDTMAHPKAPFPLVFVCSSIKNLSSANCKSTDEIEAKILVNEVQKYTCRDSWPAVWEKRDDPDDPSKICIMTPSAAQVILFSDYGLVYYTE